MAALFGKAATEYLPLENTPAKAIATVVAGGTASVIGGGKFVNGAFQAGFAFLYNFLSSAEYSLSTKNLMVVDGDTGSFAMGEFKTATDRGSPLTPGEYDILSGTSGKFRLERRDSIYGDDLDATTGQVNIRLHGPGLSYGCLTACSDPNWKAISGIIANTSSKTMVVNSYIDPMAIIRLGAISDGSLRIRQGTEQVKWYGTLKVTK